MSLASLTWTVSGAMAGGTERRGGAGGEREEREMNEEQQEKEDEEGKEGREKEEKEEGRGRREEKGEEKGGGRRRGEGGGRREDDKREEDGKGEREEKEKSHIASLQLNRPISPLAVTLLPSPISHPQFKLTSLLSGDGCTDSPPTGVSGLGRHSVLTTHHHHILYEWPEACDLTHSDIDSTIHCHIVWDTCPLVGQLILQVISPSIAHWRVPTELD